MSSVIVLNASFEPHQVVTLKHAIGMLARKVAVIEEAIEGENFGPFPRPRVLRLIRYVYAHWLLGPGPRCSKEGVRRRDGFRCAYCLGPGSTVDHILPVSRGGRTTWENCVCSCLDCNHAKDDMTPEEARMPLLFRPYNPHRSS